MSKSMQKRIAVQRSGEWDIDELVRRVTLDSMIDTRAALAVLALAKDAQRYRKLREFVKRDKVAAQAIVWNSDGSRRRFDALVDAIEERSS
jgi:hypothetical protein